MKIEFLDVSGDAGIRVAGATLEEAFMAAGIGAYELITNTGTVRELSSITFEVEADSPETLLVRYLNELIFRFDTYAFVGSRIVIQEMSAPEAIIGERMEGGGGWRLRVVVYGEEFDRERHVQRALIKAATYHALKIGRWDGMWVVEVIFDI